MTIGHDGGILKGVFTIAKGNVKADTGKRFRRKGGEVFVPLFLPNLGLARPLKRAFRAVLFPRRKSIAFRRSPVRGGAPSALRRARNSLPAPSRAYWGPSQNKRKSPFDPHSVEKNSGKM